MEEKLVKLFIVAKEFSTKSEKFYVEVYYLGSNNEIEICIRLKKVHEVYGGSNRKISIKNGLVVPLCRKCHQDIDIIKYLRKFVQLEYEETHTREEFIKNNKRYN